MGASELPWWVRTESHHLQGHSVLYGDISDTSETVCKL
jgi:hypothetical protein